MQDPTKGVELKDEWNRFVQTGNADAFHTLYTHYHDYFMYVGLKRGVAIAKVRDNINDLFLYVFENRSKLESIIHHHNYLVTAFVRRLFRKERFSADDSTQDEAWVSQLIHPSVESDYIARSVQSQLGTILKKAIDRLPSSQAQVVYQKFYLGLSYEEISVANRISIKTAYNTLYNAYERLRREIGEDNWNAFLVALSIAMLFFLLF